MQITPVALLVDDGVRGHGGLAGLAVADDQPRADRGRSAPSCRWTSGPSDNWLTDWARCPALDLLAAAAVRLSMGPCRRSARQRVDHAAFSSGPTGTSRMRPVHLTVSPSEMCSRLAQDHRADRSLEFNARPKVGFSRRRWPELGIFALHRVGQAVDAADAVGHRHHHALVAG